jgi:hypothetical protein
MIPVAKRRSHLKQEVAQNSRIDFVPLTTRSLSGAIGRTPKAKENHP